MGDQQASDGGGSVDLGGKCGVPAGRASPPTPAPYESHPEVDRQQQRPARSASLESDSQRRRVCGALTFFCSCHALAIISAFFLPMPSTLHESAHTIISATRDGG